ncbi:helix-turn-helix domain-containing protein [Streptomyces sp. 11x1]|uniref:helix-turn-helix domain-containing protein n=1 Tax=Streptomyces sp. 11x1 TaxID=3038642 RepID=UPI00292F1C9C|nr:helix-turn-helix domain-containing protein [Streptomyces sp. 11x1]WNZ09679.1 helix-turn-helix domain-containing protein [Streptomyces sp. 11x1]
MDAIHEDIEELALLLTRLKERSHRSYAALAGRLDMNASTLHRYCAGEAVPLDFNTVKRFAALCGASPEEHVELHRRWILAVAARQRPRRTAARQARAEARRQPPRATGSTATAPIASPSHTDPPNEAPDPTAHPTPSPATNPEPIPSADRRNEAAPIPRRLTRPRPTRPHPLRSIALAATLAVACAGLTTSAAGPPSGGGEPTASARVAPEPLAAATPGGSSPRPAATPSPDAGERSISAGPTTKTSEPTMMPSDSSGPPDNRANGVGDADTTARPPTLPLTWTADSHVWRPECDHDYVIAKPPRQVPPPPAPQDASVWATSLGAVHGRTTHLQITVQGSGSAPVTLEGVRVRVVSRSAPTAPKGIAYSMYEGCGAILIPRHFSVDLDAHRPLARSLPGNQTDSPDPALDFPYRVSLREPEVLLLSARTYSCTCDWYVDLDWSSQGRTGTVRIDDHGRPFRTTTIKGLPRYWYQDAGWVPTT